jgi:hypothetical protein
MSRRSTHRATLALVFCTLMILATGLAFSRALIPPSLELSALQNNIARVRVLAVEEAGRVRCHRVEAFQGDVPEEIVVRLGGELASSVKEGQAFIVGYTTLQKIQNLKNTFEEDPEGPRVVLLPAVGPALLEDSPPMKALVTPVPPEEEIPLRPRLDAILDQLERPDPRSRIYVLAELALWPALQQEMSVADSERVRAVVAGGTLEPISLEYVLRAMVPGATDLGADWVLSECRRVTEAYGLNPDRLSPIPSLLHVALDSLGERGTAADVSYALHHIPSAHDAVSMTALEAAIALDADRTGEALLDLIWDAPLSEDVMKRAARFLAQWQEQEQEQEESESPTPPDSSHGAAREFHRKS